MNHHPYKGPALPQRQTSTGPPATLPGSAPATHVDDPYPSLSDFHDYEPNLEFDDTELHAAPPVAGIAKIPYSRYDRALYSLAWPCL
ncbi:hypothetical protein FHG87_013675 [Trinorchestia longiramus]|nr:hypothetical protein FHG87_013675 [Trinorchestia longiramus]